MLAEQNLSAIAVVDEIQKLPELLDEAHRLIEERGQVFLLTGSSARKLKRGGANLLAGRAWWAELHPLTTREITNFDLLTYLNRGGLPAVYQSEDYAEELKAYTSLYLTEEVKNEALARNVVQFSDFMELVALSNGEEISYQSLAGDCGVSPNTIKNYIQVLEDTLIAFQLRAFKKTRQRKAISRSKLFLFDVGVANQLANRGEIFDQSELFGKAFEHFIILEIRAYLSYLRKNLKMYYWRSTSQFEVDLIIGNRWAIEIKSTHSVQSKHLKGIRALKEEGLIENYAVVCCERTERVTADKIRILPWNVFLEKLWQGTILS